MIDESFNFNILLNDTEIFSKRNFWNKYPSLFDKKLSLSKDLINRYHSTQIVLFSSFAALITVVIYTQYKHAWHKLKKASFTVHFFRTLTMFWL